MTQEQLAEAMGYSHKSSINKIEMGKTDLPQSKLIAFAKVLGVTPCELLGFEPTKASDTFKNRLLFAMQQNNVKAADLATRTGLSKAQISQYVNGVYEAKQQALYKLAVALNVSEAWLMGHDVPMGRLLVNKEQEQTSMFQQIQLYFGSEAEQIMKLFVQLNKQGKNKAIETLKDLSSIPKYSEETYTIKKAARNGDFEEKIITKKELDYIKNLPDVDDMK